MYMYNLRTKVFQATETQHMPASIVLAANIQLFKKLSRQVDFSYAMLGKD